MRTFTSKHAPRERFRKTAGSANKKICSYSLGYMGQGAAYNFMSTYFIVFMTDCVGLGSSPAASIMSAALLAEVVSGMIIGNISDNCRSRLGKRRPFILLACVTLPIIILLLFTPINSGGGIKFTYYLIFSILFRISFSSYEIPGNAFGAEIASGYDERTRLRTVSRIFGILGNTVAYILPLLMLDAFETQSSGWRVSSFVIALLCFVTWLLTFFLTKPYSVQLENPRPNPVRQNPACQSRANRRDLFSGNSGKDANNSERGILKGILSSYLQLSKLKPMRMLIIYKAAFSCAIALFNIGTVYYMRCCAGLSNTHISYVYFITSAVFLITTPVINKSALRIGKANQQKFILGAAAAAGIVIFLFFSNSVAAAFVYIIIFAAAQNSFWQLSTPIFYDIVEADEFVNGKRREGDVMSMVSVLGTLTTSVIVQIFGILLDISGYVPETPAQPESVIIFLKSAYVLVPGLCFLIASAALAKFPINKKTFASLSAAVKKKNNHEDYSEYAEDLNKIFK